MEAVLRAGGYRVLAARDNEHACELAERHPGRIDLLIVNFTFHGRSSTDVAERIRAARPEAKLLQISGRSPEMLKDEDRLVAGATFLCKPFTAQQLRGAVRDVLEARKSTLTGEYH
jgi:two-component system cell cycle sensor histidine kinase/response regulator CckA